MNLILCRNAVPVDHSPIYAGQAFYFSAGKIGHSEAFDGWTHEQTIHEELGEPEIGEDGQIIKQELVIKEVVTWSLVAAPPEPIDEPEPPTPEQIRAAMPVIYPTDFALLLKGLVTANYPNGVLPSDVEAIIAAIPDQATRELARWDFNRAGKFERSNAWIDIIGAQFPMTPEEMDVAWMAFAAALEAANDAPLGAVDA